MAAVRTSGAVVLPSVLFCDFAHLADEIARLEEAGAQALHLDVMDGIFVPNITYGMPIVAAVRSCTKLPIDVHLMIADPAKYIDQFRDAGADSMTIHLEAVPEPRPVLDRIRKLGADAGLAINPPTPVAHVVPHLASCDMVLVMSVMPGFGGQSFQPIALEKLRYLRNLPAASHLLLEVDGGVNHDTIGSCAEAGATLFVAGSAVFKQPDYRQAIADLENRALAGAQNASK
ncbi:MAG: ribulose-phosphate 3-epimerase [Planctomycetota bacterium]|nr:ribulose-phosphate 3-epimerase [Planctomycetota bacterium]